MMEVVEAMVGGTKEEEEVVKLLNVWSSPFGMRVTFALKLKGVKYELIKQNLIEKSKLLIEANPVYKKVPVLIHNGKPICESSIIVQYIDETWPAKEPENDLLPKQPLARAYARFWADYSDKKVFEVFRRMIRSSGEELQKIKAELIGNLEVIERELKDEFPFFDGNRIGFVDVVLEPLVAWLPMLGSLSGGDPLDLVKTKLPRLHKFMDSVKESTLKDCLIDSNKIIELVKGLRKNKFGLE